jgi:predicted alpha-1,6-mannanase (GH76 family)
VTVWAERAAASSRALVTAYWDDRRDLFRIVHPRPRVPSLRWHYWWQAHALDSLVLAGDGDRARRLVLGVLHRNGGRITNDYYDDMAWMGLALQGASAAGLLPVSALVDELMAQLHEGFDAEHGAVLWRRKDTYLNIAANAPAAILAARAGDRPFAERIADWLHRTLVSADGVVLDGVHPGRPAVDSTWTYNYGTVIGADVALGELDRARTVAATAVQRLTGPDGLLRDEGGGDGGLFKGVFARHLGALITATGDADLRALLVRNAESAWESRSPDGLTGPDWSRPPDGPVELSTHLSGVLLLHTVASIS